MSVTAITLRYSYREYMRFEDEAREKHEFVAGLILAMAGGTLEHARLAAAVVATLSRELRGRRCAVFESNARVRIQATGNAYYPDASVVCDSVRTDKEDERSMINPTVLVEVLSPSTAEYDRTEKLADYQLIESVRHIVHVAHDETRIDVWTRAGAAFSVSTYYTGQVAKLDAIGCALDVDEIYHDPLAQP